jgi:hypothetical protein
MMIAIMKFPPVREQTTSGRYHRSEDGGNAAGR